MPDDINDLLAGVSRLRGRQNAARLADPLERPEPPKQRDPLGRRLRLENSDHGDYYSLEGEHVRSGDALELFTNAANGWIRGRFEWDGTGDTRPTLVISLWDPRQNKDADGLPPHVGQVRIELPRQAVLRWAN